MALDDTLGHRWRNHRINYQRRSLFAIVANPSDSSTWTGAIIGVFAGVIIGSLIASIGSFATIVKIILESAEEKQKPPTP